MEKINKPNNSIFDRRLLFNPTIGIVIQSLAILSFLFVLIGPEGAIRTYSFYPISIILIACVVNIFLYFFSRKFNFDQFIYEFDDGDLRTKKELRRVITRDGFLSAYGYLQVKEEAFLSSRDSENHAKSEMKKVNAKQKYPDVFSK